MQRNTCMETNTDKHLFWHAFGELPTWQKVAIPIAALMIAPLLVMFATLCALSLFPFFLFGRWEGNLERAPLMHDMKRALHRGRVRTETYYAT